MKVCTHCNKTKELSEFPFRKERGYHNSYCRECCRKQSRERNAKNPFAHRASNKRFMERNPKRWEEITRKSKQKHKERIKENHKKTI